MSKPDANKLIEDKCVGGFKTHSIRIKSLINATLIGCVELTKTLLRTHYPFILKQVSQEITRRSAEWG